MTTKKCESMVMTCVNNECTVRIENLNKFEWMKTTESRVQSFRDSSLKLIERSFLHYSKLLKTDNLVEKIKKNEINNDKIVDGIDYSEIHSNKNNKKFYIVVSVIIINGIKAIISLFAS